MSDLLDRIARAGHARAVELGDKAGLLLFECSHPMPAEVQWTEYRGGKFDTTNGFHRSEPWPVLGEQMEEHAKRVVTKGNGTWIMGATSSNGRCRDADVTGVTMPTLDCDGRGDWTQIREVLDEARLAYVAQRSSSHTTDTPKWHVTPALSAPWAGIKPHWRLIWRWFGGFMSGVAGLRVDFDADPPSYGFDHTTDRLGQPIFLSAKRHRSQEPPETVAVDGLALDMEEFLSRSGFDRSWFEQEPTYEPAPADAKTIAPTEGLLALAFAEAGMLGKRIERGDLCGFAVECPTEHTHTTGRRLDGSTMIADPARGQKSGYFICLHRCGRKAPREVLRLLPDDAVGRARNRHAAALKENDDGGDAATRCTELGNATRLVTRFADRIRFCHGRGWFVWDGKVWKADTTGAIVRIAKLVVAGLWKEAAQCSDPMMRSALLEHARKSEKASAIAAMIKLAESADGIAIDVSAFDANPDDFNCKSGILDLRTQTLRPHDPAALCTKLAPVGYDPSARCTVWLRTLATVLPDPDVRAFLQRWCGYMLTGSTRERAIVLFIGRGRNGKSLIIRVLVTMMGDYATYAAPDVIMAQANGPRHPTELADLCGVRFAALSETKKGRKFDEETLKRLTGDEPIKARFMNKDFFVFDMLAKLIMAANHRPHVSDTTDSIWDRLREIPYTVRIAKGQEDKQLFAKLLAELPGIFRWAVEGCAVWQRDGLGDARAVTEAVDAYRSGEDPFMTFFAEQVIFGKVSDTTCFVTRKNLREAYVRWCSESERLAGSPADLVEAMLAKECAEKKIRGERFWLGARLRDFNDGPADEPKNASAAPTENGTPQADKTGVRADGASGAADPNSFSIEPLTRERPRNGCPPCPTAPEALDDDEYERLEREAIQAEVLQ